MKLLASSFLLIMLSLFCTAQNKTSPPFSGVAKTINSDWTFKYFPTASADKGYESPSFDDSKWAAISIPHTWNTYETTGGLLPFRRNESENVNTDWLNGWGWYRKRFSINQSYSEKKVFIEFEGIQQYCKLWINSAYLGDHLGGYGSFDFDITSHIKKGSDNVIVVAVNNKGNDNGYGGIYRDVTLVLKNKTYIPMQGSASHEGGTFITTPDLSEKSGIVRIQTWVKNDDSQAKEFTLQSTVSDASGKPVQVVKTTVQIKAGELFRFDQLTKPVKPPHLWSPDDPYIYKVVSELSDGKGIIDKYTSAFGFRWIKWDYTENILYVNGKKTFLRGGNTPQDYPLLGNAVPKWITVRDYTEMAHNLKYNFVRAVQYPIDKSVNDVADRLGIMVEDGIPDINNQVFAPEVRKQQLREMIRRDRNHAGVIFWSTGNQTDNAVARFVMSEDTTRIIAGKGVENALLSATAAEKGITETTPITFRGEPAKIVLRTVQPEITADRGSVTIIHADLMDSKGNNVYNSTNTLRWSVTGPAKLAGPPVYESESGIIRSTGEPGKIKVKVSAAGLASGLVEINAKPYQPDNSVIVEPALKNDGRAGVERTVLKPSRLEETANEIKNTGTDIKLTASDKAGYIKAIKDYFKQNNPAVDSASIEFRVFAGLTGAYLFNNEGLMIADDYNYNSDCFNNCRLIAGYISATKLPQPFKDGLRNYYAESIMLKGKEMNAGDEMNWLNWIPSGGTVVYYTDNTKMPAPKGTIYTSRNELTDIIMAVYPDFIKLSDDGKVRAIDFIDKMNPYVNPVSENQIIDGKPVSKTRLLAEKGKPVLIPLYKFIAE